MISPRRVLIPTSGQPGLLTPLAQAYARRGFDVVGGADNFFLRQASFDLVHFQWPEELSGWQPPDEDALARMGAAVDWWTARCPTVVTVHNYYPHRFEGDTRYHRLYQLFYERCSVIVHHSRTSIEMIRTEWPNTADRHHALGVCRSFPELRRPESEDRARSRTTLGVGSNEFVVLLFGALRSWDECQLVMNAFDDTTLGQKRLLMAGRYHEPVALGSWQRRSRRYRWTRWLNRRDAIVARGVVPDDQVYRYLDAADAMVIPRIHALSSGVVGLAMTFGKLLIAPDHGAFPEYLAGTGNLLYRSGDSGSLATAITHAATVDPVQIRVANLRLADERTIDHTVAAALAGVGLD